MDNLSNRLNALGLQNQKKPQPSPPLRSANSELASHVGGMWINNQFGSLLVTEEIFPPDYLHGVEPLSNTSSLGELWRAAGIRGAEPPALDNILFLDTETTGLSGGTGTYAFMVGLGDFTNAGLRVRQLFMDHPAEEPALLDILKSLLGNVDTVVSYNGKSFDIPLLRTRFLLNQDEDPFGGISHIDLLHLSRRLYRNRLPDRSLGNMENQVLGFRRTTAEVPGYLIPSIYFDYLQTHDPQPLVGVFTHNKYDILSLAGLFLHYAAQFTQPQHDQLHELDRLALARIYEDMGDVDKAVSFYSVSISDTLPEDIVLSSVLRYSRIEKRKGNYRTAVEILESYPRSTLHLDIAREITLLHAHYLADWTAALRWLSIAEELLAGSPLPLYRKRVIADEFSRRKKRIEGKIHRD